MLGVEWMKITRPGGVRVERVEYTIIQQILRTRCWITIRIKKSRGMLEETAFDTLFFVFFVFLFYLFLVRDEVTVRLLGLSIYMR